MAGNRSSGRRRKPTHLKLVEGRTYRLNKGEPIPPGNLAEVPAHFSDRQREVWNSTLANAPLALLKRLDAGLVECWVVAYCLHEEAVKALQSTPNIIKSPNGTPMQSPWLQILNKQTSIMIRLAAELGFSPASRARLSTEEEEADDEAERYFGPVVNK
jgi:P27 family predicted phage terminase small subunit